MEVLVFFLELKQFVFQLDYFDLLLFLLETLHFCLWFQHFLQIKTIPFLLPLSFRHDFVHLFGQLQNLTFQSLILLNQFLSVEFFD